MGTIDFPELELAGTALGCHQNVGSTKKPQKRDLRDTFRRAVVGICDPVSVGVDRARRSFPGRYPEIDPKSLLRAFMSLDIR